MVEDVRYDLAGLEEICHSIFRGHNQVILLAENYSGRELEAVMRRLKEATGKNYTYEWEPGKRIEVRCT